MYTKPKHRRRITREQLMADFTAVSSSVEKYLKQGRPLTLLQFESMSLTVSLLQTFLNIWNMRRGFKVQLSKRVVTDSWNPNTQGNPTLPNMNREKQHPAAVVLGRLGGLKGGKARAMKLSPKRRVAIARAAATARWTKS